MAGAAWSGERIPLSPAPAKQGRVSVEEALFKRRSVRDFQAKDLDKRQVSQLLWAAQGVTGKAGLRTAPSAGALYPLEIFALDKTGCYRYLPNEHSLERTASGDLRPKLVTAALGQSSAGKAPLDLVIAGSPEKLAWKYKGRSERYTLIEAGHAAQNILLQATAMGLGAVPIGAFSDAKVSKLLSLSPGVTPYYIIPVGYPKR